MQHSILETALESLNKNKMRTVLTVIGIVIGVATVIFVLSTGLAIKGFIIGEMEAFGSNYIEIEVKTPQTSQASADNAFSMVGGSIITTLKESDGVAMTKHPNISRFYAGVLGQKTATYENEFRQAVLFGVNAAFIDIDKSEVEFGRFFNENENQSLSKVIVLGAKMKQKLYGESDAVGTVIKIGNEHFNVIGVLEERGATFGFDMDNMVYMPLRTLQKRVLGIDYVTFIFGQTINPDISARTADDITQLVRERHQITDPDKDDFAVITMEQALDLLSTVIIGIQALLIALGSISMVVGGVGIMNIMYVSVTERTSEIGLRKSVGATSQNIFTQFLYEATIITLAGGIIGIIVGVGLSYLVSLGAQSQGYNWQFTVSWVGILLAVSMSTIVGLLFGLYPAKQAAKKSPIDAIRFE